jgi:hypothetical protein
MKKYFEYIILSTTIFLKMSVIAGKYLSRLLVRSADGIVVILSLEMNKIKIHNEWFQPIVKTTCSCGKKKVQVAAWGNYISGKWRTIDYCCESCFSTKIVPRLTSHAAGCGCSFNLTARSGYSLPSWIKMPELCKVAS